MKRILSAVLAVLCAAPAAAQTWTQLAAPGPPGPRNLLGCWFDGADPDHGVATGFYVQAFDLIPFVYTTVNGGSTWQYQTPYFTGSFLAARAVIFTSSLNGFLVGGGVARTQDGGTTWDLAADVFTVGGQLSDVTFSSPTHGWAVGEPWNGTGGLLCTTVNSGGTWTCTNVNDPNPLVAVAPQLTSVARPPQRCWSPEESRAPWMTGRSSDRPTTERPGWRPASPRTSTRSDSPRQAPAAPGPTPASCAPSTVASSGTRC